MGLDDLALDFDPLQTLGFLVTDWIEQHCKVPGGVYEGEPLLFNGWQLFCTANHYRILENAVADSRRLIAPFVYRRSVVVGPQKCGKSPWGAGMLLAEGVGPTIFIGWAKGGEVYRCSDHGCACGWEYEYVPGEAMGAPRRKSLLGLLAYAETQTQNVYEPLQTMIHSGPLAEFVHVREGFVRLPNRGKIVPLSAAAKSKLGQPLTGGMGDESGLYTAANKVLDTWQTMRRGIAAMQGRTIELTNPWDPTENSAAQQAFKSKSTDIFRYYRKPPSELDYSKKRERHKIHVHVYADSPWVDVDGIDAEADELMETDPPQAERFFGNRVVQNLGSWLSIEAWNARAEKRTVKLGEPVTVGFDGSDVDDQTGFRCETRDGYQFTPKLPDGRSMVWNPADHGGQVPRLEVRAAMSHIFATYTVIRAYCDPPYWESECDAWAEEFGEKRVIRWYTRRAIQMHAAAERLRVDVVKAESPFRHDGCSTTADHIAAARRRYPSPTATTEGTALRYVLAKPGDGRKIDMAIPSILAHEAAGDVTAAKEWAKPTRKNARMIILT